MTQTQDEEGCIVAVSVLVALQTRDKVRIRVVNGLLVVKRLT